jgi:hypothetical protein
MTLGSAAAAQVRLTDWCKGLPTPGRARAGRPPHLTGMKLDLTEEEAAALLRELDEIIESDRYFLSPRIQTLRAIRAKLRPEPARPAASPEPRVYEPPRRGRYRRRG